MDSESRRTYVTDSLKNKLGLAVTKSGVLNLNTFGNDQVERRRCDQVQLQLKGQTKEISALSFPKICAPLSKTLDMSQYPHLEGLELADDHLFGDDVPSEIDILIGSDYYYIITGEIQRGDMCSKQVMFKNSPRNETIVSFVVEQPDICHRTMPS